MNSFFGRKTNLKSVEKKNNRNAGTRVIIRRGWLVKDSPRAKENKSKILKPRSDSLKCHHFTIRKIKRVVKKIFKE